MLRLVGTLLQIKVRKYFNRAHFMTGRLSNRFLRLHLLSIVRKVVLRPNARTFAHNLHLTLVAQMVSSTPANTNMPPEIRTPSLLCSATTLILKLRVHRERSQRSSQA